MKDEIFTNTWQASSGKRGAMAGGDVSDAELKKMAQAIGVADESILRELVALGFTGDTARLLWLTASLQVAWADGYVSFRESELLLRAARSRESMAYPKASELLFHWLDNRPSDEFFKQSLHLMREILATISPADRALLQKDLLAHCREVAAVSRDMTGFHRRGVAEEASVIDQIAVAI